MVSVTVFPHEWSSNTSRSRSFNQAHLDSPIHRSQSWQLPSGISGIGIGDGIDLAWPGGNSFPSGFPHGIDIEWDCAERALLSDGFPVEQLRLGHLRSSCSKKATRSRQI